MNNGKRKEFLNTGILGDGAGVPSKQEFRPVKTEYIGTPKYDAKYFETFPTAWASAYAFRKSLETDGKAKDGREPPAAEAEAQADAATLEWVTLFLLHYYGNINLVRYDEKELTGSYDKDLWLALSGTYPSMKGGGVSSIRLLEADGRIIGAYYPEVIFFPSRGRSTWLRGENDPFRQYLEGTTLSWGKSSGALLQDDAEREAFHQHLRAVADSVLQTKTLKDRLHAFCDRAFGRSEQASKRLAAEPENWDIPANKAKKREPQEYLDKYPFVLEQNEKGGKTFYLVSTMPHPTPWMKQVIESGWPAPVNYKIKSPTEIAVSFGNEEVVCPVDKTKDEIIELKSLFLADAPYWCKVPRASDSFTAKVSALHRVELRDPVLKANEVALCLAPLKSDFLLRFHRIFWSLDRVSAVPGPDNGVIWTFTIHNKEVKWHTRPIRQAEMPNTTLALWPPKMSPRWKLYVGYGTGSKVMCGRWHLIDENGWKGTNIELEDEEYISLLHRSKASNMPKALLLSDGSEQEKERGVLFLADSKEDLQDVDDEKPASLAVDFGTSNTCLAYRNGESEVLNFKLSPVMLWGENPQIETAGFVPFQWGGAKGYFPTILLSRKSDGKLPDLTPTEIKLEHLFKVDIPGLHKGLEVRLYTGKLDASWRLHQNLKWDPNPKKPWRSLFLELLLLYTHAELFFNRGSFIGEYTFTFPLAFSAEEQERYQEKAEEAIKRIRQHCYGELLADKFTTRCVDESTAIATFIRGDKATNVTLDVFVDVGGGTADIAVRYDRKFLVLDSIKVAGNTFFRFAKQNFEQLLRGGAQFKRHLTLLLDVTEELLKLRVNDPKLDFGNFYSLAINRLTDDMFKDREADILNKGMGKASSYQRYRTLLFFRHLLTYALLQACAATVAHKISAPSGINLILGGNAWGLMLFAELPRSKEKVQEEAHKILELLKANLTPSVTEEEAPYLRELKIASVELLNQKTLSRAKVGVAIGALSAGSSDKSRTRYAGVSIGQLAVNDFEAADIRWCDRWGFDELKGRLGDMDAIHTASTLR